MAESRADLPTQLVIVFLVLAGLSLRWPFRVTIETLEGAGATDRTIVAFVSTFLMIVAGLPGLVAATKPRIATRLGFGLVAASLVALLVGCLGTLVWIASTVRAIGGTLSPLQVVEYVVPPLMTSLVAVWLRFRIRRAPDDMGP